MTIWAFLPNGGHVSDPEPVLGDVVEVAADVLDPPGEFPPPGWKAWGADEPHATASTLVATSSAPLTGRRTRFPPLS